MCWKYFLFLDLVVVGEYGFFNKNFPELWYMQLFSVSFQRLGRVVISWMWVDSQLGWLATSLMVNLPITRTYTSVHVQMYTISN